MGDDVAGPVFLAAVCAVMAGNLLTLLLIAGGRAYGRGRKTPQGAPGWSIAALVSGGVFAGIGVFMFVLSVIAAGMEAPADEEVRAVQVSAP